MYTFTTNGKTVSIFPSSEAGAPILYLNPFTGGADNYLRLLTEEIIPAAEKEINGVPCWRGIAGYSLAGLFALYGIYQTDLFSRVGSMSGSQA